MKNFRKVLASLLLVCMVCSMLAIPAAADGAGEIEVKLNRYGLPMQVGEVYDLTGSVEPDNVGSVNLLWSSSNESVATVDANGVVTALALGSAEITVSTVDGLYSTVCQVVVADPVVYADSISLDKSEFSMDMGGYASLVPTIYPDTASVQRVMWLSSDENVLTVDENGSITALAAGTAVVSAYAAELDLSAEVLNEALIATCQIYVIDRAAEEEAAAAEAARIAAEEEAARKAAEEAAAAEAAKKAAEEEAARKAAEEAAAAEAAKKAAEEEAARKAAEEADAAEAAKKAAEEEAAKKAAAESTLVLPTVGLNAPADASMAFAGNPFAISTLDLGSDPSLIDNSTLPTIVVHPYGTQLGFSTVEINAAPTEIYVTLSNTSITSNVPYTWEITGAENVIALSTVEGAGSERRGISVLGEGQTTIQVSREGVAQPVTIEVTVYKELVTITDPSNGNVVPNGSSFSVTEGDRHEFVASASYGKAVTWSTNAPSVATVTDGVVEAVGAGDATITASSKNDGAEPQASSSFSVSVAAANADVPVTVPTISVTVDGVPRTGMSLSTVELNDTYALVASMSDGSSPSFVWESADPAVVSLSEGNTAQCTLTVKGKGNTTVTVKSGASSTTLNVVVLEDAVTITGSNEATLNDGTISMTAGDILNLKGSALYGSNAVTWASSHPEYVSVDASGKLTAIKAGSGIVITATSVDDQADPKASAKVTVNVSAKPAVQISCQHGNAPTFYNNEGTYAGISASIKDNAITPSNFTWKSSNEDIVTVAGTGTNNATCVVTIKGEVGPAVITASHDGCTDATISVNVIASTNVAVAVTEISITPLSSSVPVGGTLQLSTKISPTEASNKAVTWSSGDTSIATVDEKTGLVTGVKEGSVYIYASAQDGSGVKGQGVVTVTAPVRADLYVSASTNRITSAGGTAYLTARLADNSIVPNASISWTVSPADMATVSANGIVTPKRVGTFTVTGNFSAGGKIYTGSTTIQMTPVILYGNNSSYNGSNTPLYFVVNDLSSNARGVRVDGYTLVHGQHCYIYDHQGYIAVALNPAFLRTLSPSVVHNIQIDSANGTATGYFRIYGYSSAINGVKTGDENQAALWAALLFVSVIGMGAVLISRRKEWNG